MMHASAPATADLLTAIVAATRRIVDVREQRETLSALRTRAERRQTRAGRFREALQGSFPRVVAECKRRSPSRGVLREAYDPAAIARAYERAGAAAISVLTEPTFFDGALAHLAGVRDAVRLPLLRKDFIICEYQLFEAKASGADAVLLIAAALDSRSLAALHAQACALGLDVLVEVHDTDEVSIALDAGARIVGVNNRNLRTLEVDVAASEKAAARLPQGVVRVSESGLKGADDLRRLRQLGYDAFLIGERFMGAEDPGEALRRLLEDSLTTKDTKDTKASNRK
jgi:indole-3-glycerol phosphate synthase